MNEEKNREEELRDEAAEALGSPEPSAVEPPGVPDGAAPLGFQLHRTGRTVRSRTLDVRAATAEEVERTSGKSFGNVSALHTGKAFLRVAIRTTKTLKPGTVIGVVAFPYFVKKDGTVTRGDPFSDNSRRSQASGHNKLMQQLVKADPVAAKALFEKAEITELPEKGEFGIPLIEGMIAEDSVGFCIENDGVMKDLARQVTAEKREKLAKK